MIKDNKNKNKNNKLRSNIDCKYKNKTFFTSLKYALSGLKEIFLSERNIRIQTVFAIFVIILGIITDINYKEIIILLISIFLVIFSEIVNTMVEKILDLYTTEYNEEVKIIKDMAAGGVLFATTFSIIIGVIVFVPKLINIIFIS